MKNQFFKTACIFAASALFSSCNRGEKPTASVTYEKPSPLKDVFIFSTLGGKTLLMTDYETAGKMNRLTEEQHGVSMYDIGVGNAFVVDSAGTFFLCTAKHAAIGMEKWSRDIGTEITLVNWSTFIGDSVRSTYHAMKLTSGYEIDTSVTDNDSVFVRGYLTDKDGTLHLVTISGVGKKVDKDQYRNAPMTPEDRLHFQKHMLEMSLGKNIDLASLSGSPAFNKAGKVIGVYSGRTVDADDPSICHARISLFN